MQYAIPQNHKTEHSFIGLTAVNYYHQTTWLSWGSEEGSLGCAQQESKSS